MSFLFGGGGTPQANFTPSGISNPTGFSVSGGGKVSDSSTLSSNIGNLQSTFGAASSAFGALGRTVAPGFSAFRQAGLRDITNTFRANRSNLQDTLAQRRILGSSFANSQFSQQAADEADAKAKFEATSYLQELEAYNKLTQEQFDAATKSFSVAIDQSNIESSTAASLTASNNQIAGQIAVANAKLQADAQAGAGSFMGTLLGVGTKALSGGGLFSGGGIFGGAAGAGAAAGGATTADAIAFNTGTDAMLADAALFFA